MTQIEARGAQLEAVATPLPNQRRRRRTSTGTGSRISELVLVGVLGLGVLGSALGLGAAHPLATLMLATLILGGAAYLIVFTGSRLALSTPALLMAALGAFSIAQALPLPTRLLAVVAPANVEVWRGAFAVLKAPTPGWLPISLDPTATRLEALKWLAYALAFAMSAHLGARRRLDWGPLIVFGSAVVVALVSLVHRLTDAERVYGIYAPLGEFARTSIGPLLNPNNLAGYLNLGAFCGLGLMLGPDSLLPRWAIALAVAPLVGMAAETGSRAGLLALAVGLLVLAPTALRAWRRGRGSSAHRHASLAVVGVVVFGLLLALLALSPRMVNGVEDTSLKKLAMSGWVRPLLADYPWLGVGRGAFESAFQQYRIGENNLIYSHPENLLLQWAAEWGLPACGAALVALGIALRPRVLGGRSSPVAMGAFAGCVALIVQNLADLGLEVPALALAACVSLGSCWGHQWMLSNKSSPRWERVAFRAAVLASAGLVVVLSIFGSESVGDARRRLDARLDATDYEAPTEVSQLRGELRSAILEHPADPYFPRLGALVAFKVRDDGPLRWINRSLELGMSSGRSHYLLGRLLLAYARQDQAFIELRYAVGYDPELAGRVAELLLNLSHDLDVWRRAVPEGTTGGRLLLALARRLKGDAEATNRLRVLREAGRRAPDLPEARARLAEELLFALSRKERPECADGAREECLQALRDNGTALQRLTPDKSDGAELVARWWMLRGDLVQADRLLGEECGRVEVRRRCLLLRVEIVAGLRDTARTQTIARLAAAQSCTGVDDCAKLHASVAEALSRSGETALALAYYLQAARDDRSDVRWLKVAEVASLLGQHALAADALSKVERRRGKGDLETKRRLAAERVRALAESARPPVPAPGTSR